MSESNYKDAIALSNAELDPTEIAASMKEHDINLLDGKVDGRYKYTKAKKSQSSWNVSNVTVVEDVPSKLKYTISVTCVVSKALDGSKPDNELDGEESLLKFQRHITAKLKTIHSEL